MNLHPVVPPKQLPAAYREVYREIKRLKPVATREAHNYVQMRGRECEGALKGTGFGRGGKWIRGPFEMKVAFVSAKQALKMSQKDWKKHTGTHAPRLGWLEKIVQRNKFDAEYLPHNNTLVVATDNMAKLGNLGLKKALFRELVRSVQFRKWEPFNQVLKRDWQALKRLPDGPRKKAVQERVEWRQAWLEAEARDITNGLSQIEGWRWETNPKKSKWDRFLGWLKRWTKFGAHKKQVAQAQRVYSVVARNPYMIDRVMEEPVLIDNLFYQPGSHMRNDASLTEQLRHDLKAQKKSHYRCYPTNATMPPIDIDLVTGEVVLPEKI